MRKKIRCFIVPLFILLILLNTLSSVVCSQQPAQHFANYIAVENSEGLGILRGELVGKPEITDKGVTGNVRVKNETEWWIGLTPQSHHVDVKPASLKEEPYFLLVPPNSYTEYKLTFELEDDFVTFVFDNRKSGAIFLNSLQSLVDALPKDVKIPKEKELQMIYEIYDVLGDKYPKIKSGEITIWDFIDDEDVITIVNEIAKKYIGKELLSFKYALALVKLYKVSKKVANTTWIIWMYVKNKGVAPSVTFRGLRIGNRTVSEQKNLPCTYYVPEEPVGLEKIKKSILFWVKEKPANYKEKSCDENIPVSFSISPSEDSWKTYDYKLDRDFGDGRRIKGTSSIEYPSTWNAQESDKEASEQPGVFTKIVTIVHPQNKCEVVFPYALPPWKNSDFISQWTSESRDNLGLFKYFYALKSDKYKEKKLPTTEIYMIPENSPEPPLESKDIIGAGVLFMEIKRDGKNIEDLLMDSSGGVLNMTTKEDSLTEECKSVIDHMINSLKFSSVIK